MKLSFSKLYSFYMFCQIKKAFRKFEGFFFFNLNFNYFVLISCHFLAFLSYT